MEPVLINWYPEGAKAIGVGRTRMAELIAAGEIATVKCGRKRLVSPDELRAFAERLARSSAA